MDVDEDVDKKKLPAEEVPLLSQQTCPNDRFKLTYIILFLHGIGHLLPWNMFITAHEYFERRFTCLDSSNSSSCYGFSDSFENYFAFVAMSSVTITSAINIYIQSKIHFKYRMLISLLTNFVLFLFTASMVLVHTTKWVDGFFAVTLLTIIIMKFCSGIFQSSTFGFAGILPQQYTAAVMSGQACAGIFSSVSRIVTTAAFPSNGGVMVSAAVYFLSAAAMLFACIILFFILMKLEFVQYHMEQTSFRTMREQQESAINGSVNVRVRPKIPFVNIFRQIIMYAVSVFVVFAVTISLFPAIISNIQSTHPDPDSTIWTGSLFDALVCFLLFNSADFAGRYVSHWFKMPGRWQYLLLVFTFLRIVFVPLFLFCNVQPRSDRFSVLFHDDYLPVIITTAFGLSNGFFASLCMVSAPDCVEPRYRETASVIMAWFLTLGLLVGAILSFPLTHLIRM